MKPRPWLAALCAAVVAGAATGIVFAFSGGTDAARTQARARAPMHPHVLATCKAAGGRVSPRPARNSTIAFVRYAAGSYAIFLTTSHGGQARRLSARPAARPPVPRQNFQDEPSWSPDGRSIAFESDRTGHAAIYVMRADGTHTRRLSAGRPPDATPSWSPDGSRIVFSRAGEGLVVIRADGREARALTHDVNIQDIDPAWSPDGRRIAFVRREAGIGAALFLIRPNGTGLCELTPFSGSVIEPAWSPDGTRIAYSGGNGSGFGIHVVGIDGRGRRILTPEALDFHPSWSPDGRQIAFVREATLYLMNRDGTHVRRLTPPSAIDGSPVWRPAA
jgi:Tol biopolymer transport system component